MTNDFLERAEQPADQLMPAVNLTDEESEIYRGAGDAVALVKDGKISTFIYLHDVEELDDILAQTRDADAYLGMCSCYQFCQPRRLTADDPASYARLARLHGEQWSNVDGDVE